MHIFRTHTLTQSGIDSVHSSTHRAGCYCYSVPHTKNRIVHPGMCTLPSCSVCSAYAFRVRVCVACAELRECDPNRRAECTTERRKAKQSSVAGRLATRNRSICTDAGRRRRRRHRRPRRRRHSLARSHASRHARTCGSGCGCVTRRLAWRGCVHRETHT